MTKFGFLIAWPSAVLMLAAILTPGGMTGRAAAQTGTKASKPPVPAGDKINQQTPEAITAGAPRGQESVNAATAAGMKVVKDPETGKLRGPDRAEAAKMNKGEANRSIEGLRAVQLPNGVSVVDLQGRFQSYTVATRKPGGGIEIECHNTEPGHSHATDPKVDAPADTSDSENSSTVNVHGK